MTRQRNTLQNLVNHVVLVLDASYSMNGAHAAQLIKVVDGEIAYLAKRSKELNQETRVSVYVFSDTTCCIIWEMDVLRMPSIADHYQVSGNTALIDATCTALTELALITEIHGDHSFLIYVFTDGQENRSKSLPSDLLAKISGLPENWTVAAFVPDQIAKREANQFGFPRDNIAIWDTSSVRGVEEAGATMRTATETYLTSRATGVRGYKNLFSTDPTTVNKATVSAMGVKPLATSDFMLFNVITKDAVIKPFVEEHGQKFIAGRAFYPLTKLETIQPQKAVAIVEKKTSKVYVGRAARELLGLPDMIVKVKPDHNPDYIVYVQSTSLNRKLVPGTKLLWLTKPLP